MASSDPSPSDSGASDELVYDELRAIAARLMAGERADHTLQATALVHEAWLRLDGHEVGSREAFLRSAGRSMRRILVDHARRRGTLRRGEGGARELEPDALAATWEADGTDLLALDDALARLAEHDRELEQLVELRYFAGQTLEETAQVLGKTVRQVQRSWTFAQSWLRRELERGGAQA